jgi:ATP-binding cassette, subfamily B, bacterial
LSTPDKSIDFKKNIEALSSLPRFFKEIRDTNPSLFYLNILGRVVSAIIPVLSLWVGKIIIDEVILQATQKGNGDLTKLWTYVGLELGLLLISDLLNRGVALADNLLGDQYSIKSSVILINKTSEVDLDQLENSEFYDKLERARQNTVNRVSLLSNVLGQLQDLIVVISLVIGLIYFEPLLIILLVLSIIPSFLNEIKFSNTAYSLLRGWTVERRELDYLRYIGANDKTAKEIKLFGLSDFISSRFKDLSLRYYEENKKLAVNRNLWGALYNLIGTLSYYGAYAFIIFRTVGGLLTVGDLTFLSGSFARLKSRLESTFSRFTRISESALYLKDYFDFVDLKKPFIDATQLVPMPKQIIKGFVFENVHFAYAGAETNVLKGINFTLKAGEKLAFVGENGAGKTTMIKLILRFYEPTEGRILLDGVDIKRYPKAEYQAYFGVIFQDFVRYELNLRENIAVGRIESLSNDDMIEKAADLSLANEVISAVPEGLGQKLGKRFVKGIELSGGQWQKIALARAYMKDANVLILDEPTSALDARAEFEAFQRFIGLTKGKTAIIISHRFSTVRMADRIVVLDQGIIKEIGSHEELMSVNGIYAELFQLQAAGYN